MKQFLKNGTFSLGVILLSIITFGLMVQSCQMEDDTLLLNENLEYSGYLDINVYNNTKAFTEHELKIITEAFMRIDKYLTEKNDLAFILGNKRDVRMSLNISENLFEYLLLGINMDNPVRNTQIRLRSGAEVESQSGPGYYMRSVKLSHSETIALMNGMQTGASHIGYWGAGFASILGQPAAAILISAKAYLEGLSWGTMENNYLQGSQSGAEYIETTIYSPTGMTYTTHQFIYH